MATTRAASRPALASDQTTASLSELAVGQRLKSAIYDADHARQPLLLAAGAVLSAAVIQRLRDRGIKRIRVSKSDLAAAGRSRQPSTAAPREAERGAATVQLPGATAAPGVSGRAAGRVILPGDAFSGGPLPSGWRRGRDSYVSVLSRREKLLPEAHSVSEFDRQVESSVEVLGQTFQDASQRKRLNWGNILAMSEAHLEQLREDLDLVVAFGNRGIGSDYPCRHSLQTALLASAIGTVMGLSRKDLLDLSTGCMIHDVGMVRVLGLIEEAGSLSHAARLEVMKHPIFISDLLSRAPHVTFAAKMVAYQMHERLDGSGYPSRRSGPQVHPLARIAAVADVYLALISARTQRAPLLPYQAIEQILVATRQGKFDPAAVRALLHVISMFPVGSAVRLSDGRVARVVRSNPLDYSRPVVEATVSQCSNPWTEFVDLSQVREVTIIEALADRDLPSGVPWSTTLLFGPPAGNSDSPLENEQPSQRNSELANDPFAALLASCPE